MIVAARVPPVAGPLLAKRLVNPSLSASLPRPPRSGPRLAVGRSGLGVEIGQQGPAADRSFKALGASNQGCALLSGSGRWSVQCVCSSSGLSDPTGLIEVRWLFRPDRRLSEGPASAF